MTQPVWNALVLGGGDPEDQFAAAHGAKVKALIPIATQPMGQWVLEALRLSGRVGRVAYVGPISGEMETLVDICVTDHGTLLGNLEAGLHALGSAPGERVLIATADIPMLTPEMVAELLDQAPKAALVYPIVRKEDCEAAYPEVKRTYTRLRDGTFTGGNLFLLDPALLQQFLPRLRAVFDARKSPLRLAAMIGPSALLGLLTGRLSIAQLEARVSAILGVPARAFITPHAAVGTDVDKESDLALAQLVLRRRQPRGQSLRADLH